MKRVALYYPWIYVRSGVERMILELVRRSRHEYTVFTNCLDYDQTYPEYRALERVVTLAPVPVERSFGAVVRAVARIARQKLDLERFDALLVSSEGLGDLITFRNRQRPVVCYCHTPVRPIYDPVYRRVWLERHPGAGLVLALLSLPYAALTRLAWRNYRRVFVNSEEVKGRVLAGRLCEPARLEVLHPGVDIGRIRPTWTYGPYFLYAGRIKWTKNVGLALEAFQRFKQACGGGDGWRLVIAGAVDPASQSYLLDLQRRSAADAGVTYCLNPSTEELERLYDGCYALLFPSFNEDWGIVPLEAMAFGKPVLAVNSGGPRESVLDGETGFLLDATPAAFAERMAWVVERPETVRRLGRAAAERARAFSWDAFVRRLDEYIDEIG